MPRKKDQPPTEWELRIRDLQEAGYSYADISDAIGLSRGAVGDLAVGRNLEPRWEVGLKLHKLHLKATRRARAASAR